MSPPYSRHIPAVTLIWATCGVVQFLVCLGEDDLGNMSMKDGDACDGHRMDVRVKWFDSSRGYGFVTDPRTDGDILLHAKVLRESGLEAPEKGAVLQVSVVEGEKGLQVATVVSAEQPAPPKPPVSKGGPKHPARVKWFDRAKGFGFLTVFGVEGDVFIHMETLRECGLPGLETGEAVAAEIVDGPRGRMAVAIAPWDAT